MNNNRFYDHQCLQSKLYLNKDYVVHFACSSGGQDKRMCRVSMFIKLICLIPLIYLALFGSHISTIDFAGI